MRTPGYIIALLFASSSIKKVKASCYAEEGGEAIADCVCHESCATCGYSEDPSADETSCITCAPGEGIELIAYWEDGTGYCNVPGPDNCLAAVGDETPMEDCQCHHTCGTACGYVIDVPDSIPEEYADEFAAEFSPDTEFHCIDCVDGLTLYPMWEDGSGVCHGPQQCMDGTTFESADASAECACEDNCQMCGGQGDLFEAAPNNCIVCKSSITQPTLSSDVAMAGYCEDVSMDDFVAELLDYYLEYYEEYYGEEDDDEDSASSIKTGLAAVTMAVMLQF